MKITIKDKELDVKYSLRGQLIFEKVADKGFAINGLYDFVLFLYCSILASNKDYNIDWDDFLDYVDEHPDILIEFTNMVSEKMKINKIINGDKDTDEQTDTEAEKKS